MSICGIFYTFSGKNCVFEYLVQLQHTSTTHLIWGICSTNVHYGYFTTLPDWWSTSACPSILCGSWCTTTESPANRTASPPLETSRPSPRPARSVPWCHEGPLWRPLPKKTERERDYLRWSVSILHHLRHQTKSVIAFKQCPKHSYCNPTPSPESYALNPGMTGCWKQRTQCLNCFNSSHSEHWTKIKN